MYGHIPDRAKYCLERASVCDSAIAETYPGSTECHFWRDQAQKWRSLSESYAIQTTTPGPSSLETPNDTELLLLEQRQRRGALLKVSLKSASAA